MITFTCITYLISDYIKQIRNISFLIISLLVFNACEETVSLELPFEDKLVMMSFFDSNSSWEIEVSTNGNILDDENNIEFISDARVIIYDQNNVELYELEHDQNGVYISPEGYKPSSARGYHVKVEVGAEVLTAYSYVPEQSKLRINKFSLVEEDMSKGVEVDFQIEDKSNIEAYYIWEIVNIEEDSISEGGEKSDKLSDDILNNLNGSSVESELDKREILGAGVFGDGTYSTVYNTLDGRKSGRGIAIATGTYSGNGANSILIEDKLDLEEDFDDLFGLYDPNGDDDDPINQEDDNNVKLNYELRVVSISKELYDFYNSLDGDAQYTNVYNGVGIFAGFNESTIQF